MFYSQAILTRKGPLGKIWLAAHYDKKLSKAQIFTTDIIESIRCVLEPSDPLALRVSGHLMLGIVKIHNRKYKYLQADANDAMWKMKLAFKTGSVDLSEAQLNAYGIDDLRYFGAASSEQDFPDLENTAFAVQLSGIGGEPMLLSYGEAADDDSSVDMWQRNQIGFGTPQSNIEIARGERTSLLSNRGDRTTLTNQRSSFQQIGDISRLSVGYEDEMPVFGDQDDLLMMGEEADLPYYPDEEGAYPDEGGGYEPYEEAANGNEETKGGSQGLEVVPDAVDDEAEKISAIKKKNKRRRVAVIDSKVELSAKELKKTLQDRSALLYRKPDDPFSNKESIPSLKPSTLSNIPGLCPELEELFSSSLKPRESHSTRASRMSKTAQDPEVARRQSRQSNEPQINQFDETLQVEETPYSPQDGPTFDYDMGGGDNGGDFYPEPEADTMYGAADEEKYEGVYEEDPEAYQRQSLARESAIVNEPIAANSDEWNPRTRHVFEIVNDQLQRHDSITFQDLSIGVSKRTAAACFLEILQIKTWNFIDVTQDEPFGPIIITKVQ